MVLELVLALSDLLQPGVGLDFGSCGVSLVSLLWALEEARPHRAKEETVCNLP